MFPEKKNLFPLWMVIPITSRLKCKNPTTRMIIRCNDPIAIVSKRWIESTFSDVWWHWIGSKLGVRLVVRFGDGRSRSSFMDSNKLEKFHKGNKYLREREMEGESPKCMSTLDLWKKRARMENVPVQSVNDCQGFESVQEQLRTLARVSKNMVVK